MDDPVHGSLPFITRKDLDFGDEAKFELVMETQASQVVNLALRTVSKENISKFSHETTGGGVITQTIHQIPEIPILISIVDDGQTLKQGECFARVFMRINEEVVYEFCSGPVSGMRSVNFPVSATQDQAPNRGTFRVFAGADPAVGDEIADVVPVGRIWKLLAASFELVAAAAGGVRTLQFVIKPPSGPSLKFIASTTQAASMTRFYTAANFGALLDGDDDNDILIPLASDLWLIEGTTLTTITTALNAGDNYGPTNYYVEQFFRTPN